MFRNYNHEGMFNNTSPKISFYFGLVLGLAVVSTVGFLILLSFYTSGRASSKKVTGESAGAAATSQTAGNNKEITFAPITSEDHSRGPSNAKITFLTYTDFECPGCKGFHATMNQLIQAYPNDVRWILRHFPLNIHTKSRTEAQAAECASEQGKFWEFADKIFNVTLSNDRLDLDKLPDYASEVGLDVNKFKSCLESEKYKDKVQKNYEDAISVGAEGTPYFLAITEKGTFPAFGSFPIETLKDAVDQMLASK